MGTYATTSSLLLLLPGLPQTTTAAGYTSCVALMGSQITRAEALIDAKIGGRYTLPLSPIPPVIRAIAEDISGYYIYRSYSIQDNQNRANYEALRDIYQDAIKQLDEIGSGALDLMDTSGSAVAETIEHGADSNTIDYQPFFDVDDPTDWAFDSENLDDVADKR